MHPFAPRRRRRRLRRRLRSWPVAAALAVAAALVAATTVGRAHDAARRWGEHRPVPVAAVDVAAGHRLAEGDVRWEDRPTALLPVAVARDPVGRVAAAPVLAGEVVAEARLAPGAAEGPLALAPPGSRVVAVPASPGWPPLRPGDRVDLLSAPPAGLDRPRWAARGAVVLGVGADAAVVAVAPGEAEATAAAAASGAATPVLVVPG